MDYEDLVLEVARWAREAEAAVTAKLQAGQRGEAFEPKESDHDQAA
jgi:hypothetical protein